MLFQLTFILSCKIIIIIIIIFFFFMVLVIAIHNNPAISFFALCVELHLLQLNMKIHPLWSVPVTRW